MAQEPSPKAGWLARRREARRIKKEKRAQRIAEERRHEGAGAEHATRHWEDAGGGGGG